MLAPNVKKTQAEIDKFMTSNDVVFDTFNTSMSFKSNLLIAGKNFKYLFTYLKQLLEFVKNIYLVMDTQVLTQDVLESISTNKPKINILASQAVDTIRIQTFGVASPKIYKIFRVDDYNVTITLENGVWEVDALIVQVKAEIGGQIIYPTIKTFEGKIEVYFHDKISKDYFLIFV